MNCCTSGVFIVDVRMLQYHQCRCRVIIGVLEGSLQNIKSEVAHGTIVRKANQRHVIGIEGWGCTAEILLFCMRLLRENEMRRGMESKNLSKMFEESGAELISQTKLCEILQRNMPILKVNLARELRNTWSAGI